MGRRVAAGVDPPPTAERGVTVPVRTPARLPLMHDRPAPGPAGQARDSGRAGTTIAARHGVAGVPGPGL